MGLPARIGGVSPLAKGAAPPEAPPAALIVEPPPAEPATAEVDATATIEVAEASLPVPIPVPRPARADPDGAGVGAGVGAGAEQPLALLLPPPRPAASNQPETEPDATMAAATAADDIAAPPPAEPVLEPEDPDAPTRFASLTAPLPKTRPALPTLSRSVPSVTALPAITGATQRSIQAAATKQGLPLDRTALIGILDLDAGRKALLRLPNGRYRTVVVGDVLDGWRVSMIGVDAMRITRSSEDRTFLLVNR